MDLHPTTIHQSRWVGRGTSEPWPLHSSWIPAPLESLFDELGFPVAPHADQNGGGLGGIGAQDEETVEP